MTPRTPEQYPGPRAHAGVRLLEVTARRSSQDESVSRDTCQHCGYGHGLHVRRPHSIYHRNTTYAGTMGCLFLLFVNVISDQKKGEARDWNMGIQSSQTLQPGDSRAASATDSDVRGARASRFNSQHHQAALR